MVTFFAEGTPRPKGSKKAFTPKGWARPILVEVSKGEGSWRATVAKTAADAMRAAQLAPIEGPVRLKLEFYEPRPKGHFGKKGLKPNAQPRPTKAPDADKLMRSIGDALNKVCWRDDAQVCCAEIHKLYTDDTQPFGGVRVTVAPWRAETPNGG